MGSATGIAWTDATWNPVRGCSRVSEGCRNCYAEKIAARFSGTGKPFEGFAEHPAYSYGPPAACHRPARPTWTGRVELIPEKLSEPLHWRKPRRVFVNSMSDLFHEKLMFEDIAAVFGVMAVTPHLTYQILTKRPSRMREWFREMAEIAPRYSERGEVNECHRRAWQAGNDEVAAATSRPASVPWPLPNVWLGVSVEDQKTADERIPLLLETAAAVRFVSYEPALGPVNFEREAIVQTTAGEKMVQPLYCRETNGVGRLHWLIVGGESGPKARPFDVFWARSVFRQAKRAHVPVFMKQLGAHPVGEPWAVNRKFSPLATSRSGSDPVEWPPDLRVREFPEPRG